MNATTIKLFTFLIVIASLSSIGCNSKDTAKSSSSSSGAPTSSQAQSAASQTPSAFIDEKQTVPAGKEWNREIVAKRPGTVTIEITAEAPKSIIVLTTEAFRGMLGQSSHKMDKEKDILLIDETTENSYTKEVDFPAGSFHIMMQNRAETPQEFHLRCVAK